MNSTANSSNPYVYPEDYDTKEQQYMDDYELILEWARHCGGPVADLGCGTGRLLLPLTSQGMDAVGADASRSMLDLAARKAVEAGLSIPLYETDLTSLVLPGSFAMMYMVGNTF